MWSDDCRAFIAHWAQLRGDAILPTTETFFDHATGQFAPYLYVVELTDDVALVRFQGTVLDERWAAQLTGKDLHEGMPATLRRRSLSNMRRIVSQPCGYIARNAYATSLGRTVTADLVQLPLAARDGRPPARGVSVADAARRRYGREGIR
ncbi:MAG: PAS domain-containing protein, partial [Rhodospirillaceae bacterium]|nr:PAS domain-containing protein [Rhodospirillaceae bacterium]